MLVVLLGMAYSLLGCNIVSDSTLSCCVVIKQSDDKFCGRYLDDKLDAHFGMTN